MALKASKARVEPLAFDCDADPDPAFQFDANLVFCVDEDPESAFLKDADPDPQDCISVSAFFRAKIKLVGKK
jgi:hypothetical protein